MKAFNTVFFLLVATLAQAQAITPKSGWLEKWENSKQYLLAIAEAMPEDAYSFQPTERQMSFEKQLIHIKDNMEWLGTTYFSDEAPDTKSDSIEYTKAQLIAALEQSFNDVAFLIDATSDESLTETVTFFAGPKSKLQILNLLQDHVTHHRGQLVVYLNLNDISPPRYTGW
jgi:uncharacterized damage-inducible protein DinB